MTFITPADLNAEAEAVRSGWATASSARDVQRSGSAADTTVAIRATPFKWRNPATIKPRAYLLGKWLLLGTVVTVIAPGGVGKSTFAGAMALSLATGRPLLGKRVHGGPRRVWVWNLEDDGDELDRQFHAAGLAHGINPEEIGDRLFRDSALDGAGLCTAEQGPAGIVILRPVMAALEAELSARRIDCLIVDPFVSSHAVGESDNMAIDAVAKEWARVGRLAECCIVLVHHARKPNGEKVTAELSRGASALTNAARTVLVLNRMGDAAASRFGIEDAAERRRLFTVDADKSNRAPPEGADWFRLDSQLLDNGGPFEGGDSVAVVKPWSPPDAFDGVTAGHLLRVQEAVNRGAWRKNSQSPDWAGRAVADVLGLNLDRSGDKAKVKRVLAEWVRNGALVEVKRRDAKRNDRVFVEVGAWANDAAAPPRKGEAGHGEEVRAGNCPTTTPSLEGGGVGRPGPALSRWGAADGEAVNSDAGAATPWDRQVEDGK